MNDFITPKLLDDVRDELTGTYSNSGIEDRQPSPEEVVRSALVEIATQLRLDADEQGECNKVDECTAGALIRYRLADWLTTRRDDCECGDESRPGLHVKGYGAMCDPDAYRQTAEEGR